MKRFIAILALVALFMAGGVGTAAYAQLSKDEEKELKKDVKKRVRELKQQKWEPLASMETMDYSMLKYRRYLAEDEENRIALVGIALGKNDKIGRENAIHNAVTDYASRAGATVTGKLKDVIASDNSTVTPQEIDRFGAAYEQAVNAGINSLVKMHFILVRSVNGNREYIAFMSIDESAARKVREEAAAGQKASLGELSEMVEQFIGTPVEGE